MPPEKRAECGCVMRADKAFEEFAIGQFIRCLLGDGAAKRVLEALIAAAGHGRLRGMESSPHSSPAQDGGPEYFGEGIPQ